MLKISFYKKSEINLKDCVKELKELDFSTHGWFTRLVIWVNILFETKRCLEFYQELYKDSIVLYNGCFYVFDFSRDCIEFNLGFDFNYNFKSISFEQFQIQIKQVVSELGLTFSKENYKVVQKYFKESSFGYCLVLID